MKRAGLGGCYLFNCGGRMPEGDVRFMQPKWLEMMDHTVREAERLGLKFGVHNCDGFSQSGGPWITPETSMKELTWTARGRRRTGRASTRCWTSRAIKEDFYRDIAVVAFPLPQGGPLTGATLRGTLPPAELAKLTDGKPQTRPSSRCRRATTRIEFVFAEPRTVRSVVCRNAAPHKWEEDFPIQLEVSADGKNFRPVGTFTANWDLIGGGAVTAACEEATGKVFRLAFKNPWPVQLRRDRVERDGAACISREAKAGAAAQPRPRRRAPASRRLSGTGSPSAAGAGTGRRPRLGAAT